MKSALFERIENEISSHDIVLYMRGTAAFPQCSFSAYIVQVLSQIGVRFRDINIMNDSELRQGLKDFSDWPTFPQLYVKNEFIGGADIVREMHQNNELKTLLEDRGLL